MADVFIPDPNLKAAINHELDPTRPPEQGITEAEMLSLTILRASSYGIINLTGLGSAINLKQLYLDNNQITNIKPLTSLQVILDLSLNNNQITDITPLIGLINLTVLYLNNNQITDISSLSGLSPFVLSLESNQITDISPLSGYRSTEYLNLSKNNITDISALGNKQSFRTLDLSNNQIIDITPLNYVAPLMHRLDLSYNQIKDISTLSKLAILDDINLDNNQIFDLTPIFYGPSFTARNQTIYFDGTWNSGTLLIPTSFLKNPDGSIPSTINNITPSYGIYSSASKTVTWRSISYNTQASYDFKGSDYFNGTVIRLANSGPKALQLQLSNPSTVTVNYNSPVIFNNVIYSSGGIDYDPTSGKITFSSSGLYSINWWIAALTALTTAGTVFGIQIISGKTIFGNGSNKLTGVNGNALIEVITPPLQIQLINLTTRNSQNINVQLSNTVPVQADISIVDFFGTPF